MFNRQRTLSSLTAVIAAVVAAVAAAPAGAARTLACAATEPAQASPYKDWVNIADDTGVPWLYPAGNSGAVRQLNCAAQSPAASAPAAPTTSSTSRSPYPGWVLVTDETGVPWLYPSQTHS